MKKILSAILAMTITALSFTGCSNNKDQVVLNVFNWGEFMDTSLNKEFEKKTGIKVKYTMYDTNESLYSALKTGGVNYDVVFPSDYMIARLIQEGLIQKIDKNNIPNYSNVMDEFKNMPYDPTNEYSVPYSWGTVGIIYNKDVVKEPVDSWNILWNEKYKDKIVMFDNPRDAFAIPLFMQGKSINTTNPDDLQSAYDMLVKQKPIIQGYCMDQMFAKLGSGEAAIGVYYAGDYLTMKKSNPSLEFVIPKEGTNKFVDSMAIPTGAKHKKEAEMYINFMLEKTSALKNVETIGYSTPNKTAYDALDEAVKNDGVSYPKDNQHKFEVFTHLPKETLELYDKLWASLKK